MISHSALFIAHIALRNNVKQKKKNQKVWRAAVAILSYLKEHPKAKDNLDGIAQWWTSEKPDVVEKALKLLIDEGVIEARGEHFQLAGKHTAHEIDDAIEKARRKL